MDAEPRSPVVGATGWAMPTLTLVDVLRAAITRPDARCGPPVDMWAAALRVSDVQKRPERFAAPPTTVPVYLGTVGRDGRPLRADQPLKR